MIVKELNFPLTYQLVKYFLNYFDFIGVFFVSFNHFDIFYIFYTKFISLFKLSYYVNFKYSSFFKFITDTSYCWTHSNSLLEFELVIE